MQHSGTLQYLQMRSTMIFFFKDNYKSGSISSWFFNFLPLNWKGNNVPVKKHLSVSNFEQAASFSLCLSATDSRQPHELWRKWKKMRISCVHQSLFFGEEKPSLKTKVKLDKYYGDSAPSISMVKKSTNLIFWKG